MPEYIHMEDWYPCLGTETERDQYIAECGRLIVVWSELLKELDDA